MRAAEFSISPAEPPSFFLHFLSQLFLVCEATANFPFSYLVRREWDGGSFLSFLSFLFFLFSPPLFLLLLLTLHQDENAHLPSSSFRKKGKSFFLFFCPACVRLFFPKIRLGSQEGFLPTAEAVVQAVLYGTCPDRTLRNFRASKSADRRILGCSETLAMNFEALKSRKNRLRLSGEGNSMLVTRSILFLCLIKNAWLNLCHRCCVRDVIKHCVIFVNSFCLEFI